MQRSIDDKNSKILELEGVNNAIFKEIRAMRQEMAILQIEKE